MMSRNKMIQELAANLDYLGMSIMARTLEYEAKSDTFMMDDPLTALSSLIEPQLDAVVNRRVDARLKAAGLLGCQAELDECTDTNSRTYTPTNVMSVIRNLDFIDNGQNLLILGASDAGKSYLAKAIAVRACSKWAVEYHHCATLIDELCDLKSENFDKYRKRMRRLTRVPLLALDDFLLHPISTDLQSAVLFELLETRIEKRLSVIICSQRSPESWITMMQDDHPRANAIAKRAARDYTVLITLNED